MSAAVCGEDAALGLHRRRRLHRIVGGHGADDEGAALLLDAGQPGHLAKVDEVRGPGEPELHRRQQAVAAGQQLGVVLVLAQQIERFLDRAGGVVVELGWIHARGPPYFFARAAWMVFQTRSAVSGIVSMWSTPRPDERVHDGVDHRRRGRDGAGLAGALDAEQVHRRRRLRAIGLVHGSMSAFGSA